MREFKNKNRKSVWKRILEGLYDFFFTMSHLGSMGDHDERMRRRRRKTKFRK